jgi:hypothetical protein
MPAIDSCEPQMMRALQKLGWSVQDRPYFMRAGTLTFFADLRLYKGSNGTGARIIIIEVKCNLDNSQDELYRAVGQYIFYRMALRLKKLDFTIYIALPDDVYRELIANKVIASVFEEMGMKLVVINLKREEVVEWIG